MENGKTTEQLVKALLKRRFRMIDEIGWFRNQHIGVLLNCTKTRKGGISGQKIPHVKIPKYEG